MNKLLNKRKVILYIAVSKDNFIAEKNGGVGFLDETNKTVNMEDLGYGQLVNRISMIVTGRKTYEQSIEFENWEWPRKKTFVFTQKEHLKIPPNHDITIVKENVKSFMHKLLSEKPNGDNDNIWLMGGAQLVKEFAVEKLIDECIITKVDETLGEGIYLDIPDFEKDFKLVDELKIASVIHQTFERK